MPFVSSPWPMLLLISAYLFIVATGKKWMEHRKPMQIERIIILYNFIQIIANSIIVLTVSLINENLLTTFRDRIHFLYIHRQHITFLLRTQISVFDVSRSVFTPMQWACIWHIWVTFVSSSNCLTYSIRCFLFYAKNGHKFRFYMYTITLWLHLWDITAFYLHQV